MNSLLGRSGVALVSGSGRGTFVVHEYHAASASQACLYKVEPSYLPFSDIKARVDVHCNRLLSAPSQKARSGHERTASHSNAAADRDNDANINGSDDRSEGDNDDDDEEEIAIAAIDEKRNTSLEFFHTLLCDHEEFKSMATTAVFFERKKRQKLKDVADELVTLIGDMKRSRSLQSVTSEEGSSEVSSANSDRELATIFRHVSRPPRKEEGRNTLPHPWPLLSKVRVYLQGDLLDSRAELADPPGLTDNNADIVEAAKRYLKDSGTVLVFTAIERATNDPALEMHLRRCIRAGNMERVILVVTGIDRLGDIEQHDWDDLPVEEREELERADAAVNTLMGEESYPASLKPEAIRARSIDRLIDLDKAVAVLQRRMMDAQAGRRQLHIKIQTRLARGTLNNKLRHLARQPSAPDLPVYFVSNSEHEKHASHTKSSDSSFLDVQAAGVLPLKSAVRKDTAGHKLNALHDAVCIAIPLALASLSGTFDQTHLCCKQSVKARMDKRLESAKRTVQAVDDRLKELLIRQVDVAFANNQEDWKRFAGGHVDGWKKLKATTFAAFCRRKGYWQTPGLSGMVSSNELIQNIMQPILISSFDAIDEGILKLRDETIAQLNQLYEGIVRELKASGGINNHTAANGLYGEVEAHRKSLIKVVRRAVNRFKARVHNIRHLTLVYTPSAQPDTSPNDYVSVSMDPIYTACIGMRGRAGTKKNSRRQPIHEDRARCLKQRIVGTEWDASVFAGVLELITAEWEHSVKLLTANLEKHLGTAAGNVQTGFDRRFLDVGKETTISLEKVKLLEEAKKMHGEMEKAVRTVHRTTEELQALQNSWNVDSDG